MEPASLFRRLWRDARGIAAVEFAFVAPVMVLFIIAVMEMGRLFLIHNAMTYAADEAARTAMVRKVITKSELEALTKSYAAVLEPERTTVNVTIEPYDDGWRTNISVQYQFHLMVSVVGLGQFNMVRSARVNRRDSF
jgi:Flp pilus assembly protein TadG